MKKLSKTARVLSVCLAVLFWFLLLQNLLYGAFSLRACISMLGASDLQGTTTITGITQGFMRIRSNTGITVSQEALLVENAFALLATLLQTPVFCYGIHLLRKILAPISQQRPFSGTSALLKKLGWLSVAMAAIRNLIDYGLIYLYEEVMQVPRLFKGGLITEIHFQYEPDFTYLILAVVIFILCAVFRYGEELQQLSDETL